MATDLRVQIQILVQDYYPAEKGGKCQAEVSRFRTRSSYRQIMALRFTLWRFSPSLLVARGGGCSWVIFPLLTPPLARYASSGKRLAREKLDSRKLGMVVFRLKCLWWLMLVNEGTFKYKKRAIAHEIEYRNQ